MENRQKKLINRIILLIIIIFIGLLYIFLCKHGYGIECFYYKNFGVQCPSCGATRAFFSLLNFDFKKAFLYNPIFTIVFYPLTLLIVLQDLSICILNLVRKTDKISLLEYIFKS